jgi:hypothetical protein
MCIFPIFLCICCFHAILLLLEPASAVLLVSYLKMICIACFSAFVCCIASHCGLLDCSNNVFCALFVLCETVHSDLQFVRQPEFQVENFFWWKSWSLWCSEVREEGGAFTHVGKIGFVWQILMDTNFFPVTRASRGLGTKEKLDLIGYEWYNMHRSQGCNPHPSSSLLSKVEIVEPKSMCPYSARSLESVWYLIWLRDFLTHVLACLIGNVLTLIADWCCCQSLSNVRILSYREMVNDQLTQLKKFLKVLP